MHDRAEYRAARAERLRQAKPKTRILNALARLLDAAYLDDAPTREQREGWKESALWARRGMDEMARRLVAMDAVVREARDIVAAWEEEQPGSNTHALCLPALRDALSALAKTEVR